MDWKRRGDKLHCKRHDVTFGQTEVCAKCVDDPGAIPTAELDTALPPPPAGCRSSEDHEKWLTALASFAEKQAKGLCTGKNRINHSTASKLFDVAIKATRAAMEFTTTRERREWVRRMAAEARKLRGAGR